MRSPASLKNAGLRPIDFKKQILYSQAYTPMPEVSGSVLPPSITIWAPVI